MVFLVLIFMTAWTAYPQYNYFYGKNKVIRQTFSWQHIQTTHFDLYYYNRKESLIKKIGGGIGKGVPDHFRLFDGESGEAHPVDFLQHPH